MAGVSNIANIWNTVKEIDLRPVRQEALTLVRIALVGAPGSGRTALSEAMRRDPLRPDEATFTPLLVLDPQEAGDLADVDLILLLIDPARGSEPADFARENELVRSWGEAGKKLLIFINQNPDLGPAKSFGPWVDWGRQRVVYVSASDPQALLREFAPAVLELLNDRLLALGRHFPLFRVPIARRLIDEASFSNAAYALSTGVAEIVPILGIPLNVADIVVLTKNQAFLVYKLGLALGLSTDWQQYVAEFGSVLGGSFLWRQIARSLIGLIPAWGIVPKVAISYAGTFVVGNVVLQWYLTGRHVSKSQMRELYGQAFVVGKKVAQSLIARAPRPRLRLGRRKPAALPAPIEIPLETTAEDNAEAALEFNATSAPPGAHEAEIPSVLEPIPAPDPESAAGICPHCSRQNALDARFCQYCGRSLH